MRLRTKPVLCNYYVTYRCNATCSFCDIWEKPSPYVTFQNVRENLEALRQIGVKVIDFTGGEPLLHRQLGDFVHLAHDMGFITTVTTNGLLYPKRAQELAGKVDMLHFSLDAADAQAHDQSRGVPCFDKVLESLELAQSLGERPDIIFTFSDDNAQEAVKIEEEICAPRGLMLILNPMFSYAGVGATPISESTFRAMTQLARRKGVYLNQGFVELIRKGGNSITDPVCRAGETTVVISPENKLVLPCYHAGLKEFEINADLHKLWNSQDVLKERELAGRLPICKSCTVNCYMQPSMATKINSYFWLALPSTLKYNLEKGTWKRLLVR